MSTWRCPNLRLGWANFPKPVSVWRVTLDFWQGMQASDSGTASGHLVERSMVVKMYRHPCDRGRGLTMSTWRCPNLQLGWANFPKPVSVWRVTLDFWQGMQAVAHDLTSAVMESQMYFFFTIFVVVFLDG